MRYSVILSEAADQQIDEQIVWYEEQQAGLGARFYRAVIEHLLLLETLPYAQVRYDTVRCIPIKGFPYMFHFGINEQEQTLTVHALIHTARDPDANWGNDDWIVSEPDYYYGVA
jgi:toxin ParE1/3/4